MLDMLDRLQEVLGVRLAAAHFEHGIRGKDSLEDAEFVREFCGARGIEFYGASADVPGEAARAGESLETAARRLRYAFLRRIAGALSEKYGISRQIIVKDISILKEQGNDILATSAGYVIRSSPLKDRVFKVFHTTEQTEDELKLIVDLGGTIADVFVWHKAYGKMEAKLNISSRAQIEQFIESVRTGKSVELMHITGGFHYHTVRANSEEILDKIGAALEKRNYIAPGI